MAVSNPTGYRNRPSDSIANSYKWYDPTAGGGLAAWNQLMSRDQSVACLPSDHF